MKFLKQLAVCLLTLSTFATAQSLNDYKSTLTLTIEQSSAVTWVMKNAEVKIDEEKAKAIVRNVYEYAAFFEMDPKLVLAVMRTESGFREKAKSWYGATGLMQVVPRWHLKKLKDRDPTNLVVSIEVGSQVLKDCLKRFRNDKAKGLNCYSGKGGQKYYNVVTKFERSLTAFVYDFTQQRMQVAMATKTYAYEERF